MDITHLRAKTCTKCGEIKPISAFGPLKSGQFGLRAFCKACGVGMNSARRKLDPEKTKERRVKEHLASAETNCERARAYYLANKEKVLEQAKLRKLANRDKVYADKAKRRSIKLNALASWADLAIIRSIYKEAKLLREQTGITYHVDHIIPLQHPLVCGLHCEANLQILTAYENLVKSNTFVAGIQP